MKTRFAIKWNFSHLFFLTLLLLLIPASGLALQSINPVLFTQDSEQTIKPSAADAHGGGQLLSTGNFETRRHIGMILDRETWANPDLPAQPTGVFIPVGDLNGDGVNDLIQRRSNLADLRTDDLSAVAHRTLIYFSGSFTGNPDHYIYDFLRPAGDLTGDGKANLLGRDIFGNPTIYSHDGTTLVETSFAINGDFPENFNLQSYKLGTDLDGDGFEDLVFRGTATGFTDSDYIFFVLYGGIQGGNIDVGVHDTRTLLTPELADMRVTDIGDVFQHDGASYILLSMRNPSNHRYAVIFSVDGDRNLELVQAIEITDYPHSAATRFITTNLSGGGDPHLVVTSSFFRDDNTFCFAPSPDENKLFVEESTPLYSGHVWAAGDLNGDGTMNFIAQESLGQPLRHAGFPDGISGGLTLGNQLPGQVHNIQILTGDDFMAGDLTGDGLSNLIYSFHNFPNTEAGVIRIGIDNLGDLTSEQFLYDVDASFPYSAEVPFALGDITGNGSDDFAIYYNRSRFPGKLKFHEGGSDWQTPAASWTIPANKALIDIASGRFTDPDRLDIVILYIEVYGPDMRRSVLEMHTGGGIPAQPPDRILDQDDIFTELTTPSPALQTMVTAGDVTNSGFDDLLIAPTMAFDPVLGPLPAVLYAGGPAFLRDTPDAEFSFPPQDLGFGIGGSLAALGDINGDGIDDFAIVNISQGEIADRQEFNTNAGGRIHIYYGRDGDTNFGEPDITLRTARQALTSGYDMMMLGFGEIASGDFLGTGRRGLAAKSFRHWDQNSSVGVPSVHVFQSNLVDEDPQPDHLLPLHASIMSTNPQGEFIGFMGRMMMTGIPDLTSNRRDELLMISSVGYVNAVLHYGRDPMSTVPDVVFESPNNGLSMGAPGNFTNRDYKTAIGDFNGDGKLNLLVRQHDSNFPDSPVYLFELGRPGGVQVQVASTQPVTSGGGTVEDEETKTKVTIPENALEEEVEVEVGTFTVVPEGADLSSVMVYLGPPGTTFSEPVEVTVSYDPDNLPVGVAEEDLVMLRYDEDTSEWEELPSTVNTEENTVTGLTTRFSGFGAGVIKIPTPTDRTDRQVPGSIALHQNYPNPFNPVTNIRWELNAEQHVLITVYDLLGRKVAELANGVYPAGAHTVTFDSGNLASGIYLYRLQAGSVMLHRKMTVVK